MNNNVLLLSEKYLKENSLVNDNVSTEYIIPAIKQAQTECLTPLLGSKLFDKLCTLVASGEISDPVNILYKELLDDYALNYLVNCTQANLQIGLTYKIRNAGAVVNSDTEHYSNADLRTIQYLEQHYRDKADQMAIRMKNFIKCHKADIPESCGCSCCDGVKPSHHIHTNINI